MKFPNFKNKNILILGLGLLGRGVRDAIFFAEQGANVTVTDLKTKEELANSLDKLKPYQINFTLGEHKAEDILNADLIIRNAGIPQNSLFLKLAQKNKIPVEMDESLFAKYCPCPIIGITGTRGKTTTTTLISKILKENLPDKKIYIAGNIQGEATLPLINKVTSNDLVVLELSSWQLQGFHSSKISPHIAVFTNIYPDHMNSYKNMTDYIYDKKAIYKYQTKNDYCFLNKDQAKIKNLAPEITSTIKYFSKQDVPTDWQIKIMGEHNLENIGAAVQVAKLFKISKPQIKSSVESFFGVEHRLELVKTINKINFINDTTSTTPISGQKALESINGPIILIAGGASKQLKLDVFAKSICNRVKALILLQGTATLELESEIKKNNCENLISGRFDNFEQAVKQAYAISLPGDTILLSPGCASFGMFKNEYDRGDQFKKIVNQLS